MTRPVSILMIAVAAPLLAAALYLAAPALRSAEASVRLRVDEHVERASRLLTDYSANKERLAELLRQLESQQVDVALGGESGATILDEQRAVVEELEARLNEQFRGAAASRIKSLEDQYRKAGGADQTALMQTGGFGGNANAILRSVREGITRCHALLEKNAKLLDEALAGVNEALAVSVGDAGGAQDADANRLKGIILVAKAKAAQRQVWLERGRAAGAREALVGLRQEAAASAVERKLVETSKIDAQIDALNEQSRQLASAVREKREELSTVEATIRDLETRIEDARAQAQAARHKMDELENQGVNLLDPGGSQSFRERYTAVAEEYHRALTNVQQLERGTLLHARIDENGDYVAGDYVPAEPGGSVVEQRGLLDYRDDRETAAADLAALEDTLASMDQAIEGLNALKTQYAERTAQADARAGQVRARAADEFTEFERQVSEADALLDRAVGMAHQAMQAYRTALATATTQTREMGERLALLGPAAKQRSPLRTRSEDRWLVGQLNNETGQARYVLGSLLFDRYAAAEADFALVESVKSDLEIAAADPATFAERRDTARQEAIETLKDAVADFEKSFRELNSHWTVPAEAAAAHDLLSLVENPAHLRTAIQNYENAVRGQEAEPFVRTLLERLEMLRKR